MVLLRLNAISVSFGAKPLLEGADLALNTRERVAIVGRNGSGKSTLLKIMNGEIKADSGELVRSHGIKVSRLPQEVPEQLRGDVYSLVAGGFGESGDLLKKYRLVSESENISGRMAELEQLQARIDAVDGWQIDQKIAATLSRVGLEPAMRLEDLSGGLKRRALLARALVTDPDILLLDEPTNHLDVQSIEWLEEYLLSLSASLVFITHDRSFLRRLATRIVELDRSVLSDWPGDYDAYLRGKQASLESEQTHFALQDKKLAQEEAWIRQGIKARRTRNEGRARALQRLRREHAERRKQPDKVRMQAQEAKGSGKIVLEAENVSVELADKAVIRNLNCTVLRGDKVGIIGPNGAGKSTLLRVLLGELPPSSGTIRMGTGVKLAYYDQLRATLNPELTALENVNGGSDKVCVNGRDRHIISYMQDFLFTPDRARAPIHALSGGERNRLLLARIFVKPSNLLVLDEPSNDLDIETLELLEEILSDYKGTILLISHDREFLDNIVTDSLVFEGEGQVNAYVGGYSDYLNQKPAPPNLLATDKKTGKTHSGKTGRVKNSTKLSYKDQRELELLPKKIEELEERQSRVHELMSRQDFYKKSPAEMLSAKKLLQELDTELESCFHRWEELEARKNAK